MGGLVDADVADHAQPPVPVSFDCLQRRRPLTGQAVPLHVLHAGLALSSRLGPARLGRDGFEAPVLGEGQEGGVEHDLVGAVVQDRRIHVVDEDGGRDATRLTKGVLEAVEEHLLRLADGELEVAPA